MQFRTLFLGSSEAEQSTVNRWVGISKFPRGAIKIITWGRAGVGEPGQTVNLLYYAEWVRIP